MQLLNLENLNIIIINMFFYTKFHPMPHLFQCDFPKVQNGSEVLRKSLKLLGIAKPS